MGKLLRYLKDHWWKPVEGDVWWHVITQLKRYFWGSWGVWNVLTSITGIVVGTYGAVQARIDSQPTYIVVALLVGLFAGVVIILNGGWALWNKWHRGHLAVQPEASPTLGPDDLIHPSFGGVLWRWNQEVGASGPFCPKHREILFYINYSDQTKLEFESEFLGRNGRFVCPTDGEEFKFPEPSTLRVRELRARVYSLLQARISQRRTTDSSTKEEGTNDLFKIEQTHSEIKWRSNFGGGFYSFLSEDKIPHDAVFALHIRAKITSDPPCFVELIWLDIAGKRIEERDWLPVRINDQREEYLDFRIPSSMAQGKHQAQLVARTRRAEGREIEKISQGFDVVIARSHSDFQRFSGTS